MFCFRAAPRQTPTRAPMRTISALTSWLNYTELVAGLACTRPGAPPDPAERPSASARLGNFWRLRHCPRKALQMCWRGCLVTSAGGIVPRPSQRAAAGPARDTCGRTRRGGRVTAEDARLYFQSLKWSTSCWSISGCSQNFPESGRVLSPRITCGTPLLCSQTQVLSPPRDFVVCR